MENANTRLFSNRQLIRLIIPLIIEQALTMLVGLCDGIMVSSVGEAAISGVSLVDMINAVVLVLFGALATGGAVVTSQFIGARKMHDAQKSVGQLVLMAAVFYLLRGKPGFQLLAGCGAAGVATLFSLFNLTAPFSCLLLYLYNGEKGNSSRVFNLICYPLMLLIAGIAAIYL